MNATLARLSRLAVDLCREPDALLLDRFLAGSEPAFRELVARHGPLVYGVCNRVLRHRQDAEDALQAVFLVLARRAADVWPRDAVGAWLYGVAYRVAQKARMRRARRMTRECPLQDYPQLDPPRPEPDTAAIIDRAIRKLPEVYRAAVIACDLEGLSRKDAAGQLGWTEGTLSGRLARARKLLADRLRKTGLTLPAGGLAAVLGAESPVRAGLEERITGLVSIAGRGEVPAPIIALTEGVVPGMFAMNFKTTAAVILVACTIGYGAWAVSAGEGLRQDEGPIAGSPPTTAQPAADTAAREQLARLEGELAALLADTKANPVGRSTEDVARRIKQLRSRLEGAEQLLDRAQTGFDKTREVWGHLPPNRSAALEMLTGNWRINSLLEAGKEIPPPKSGFGSIQIVGSTLTMPYLEGGQIPKRREYAIAVDDAKHPKTIDLIASGKPVGRGIYEFTAPATTCASCHSLEGTGFKPPLPNLIGLCGPGLKKHIGLRLAIALEGERPKQFGGNGVIVFNLERIVPKTAPAAPGPNLVELKREYERALEAVEVRRAAHRATLAELDAAKARVEQAVRDLQAEEDRLKASLESYKAAERRTQESHDRGKDGNVFTVHVRPLTSPEKVIRVPATGKETILEGLAYAADDMAIKPEALSVWVVRDKAILPVDLVAILQKGDGKTNFSLKAGDQLFVQVRVAK